MKRELLKLSVVVLLILVSISCRSKKSTTLSHKVPEAVVSTPYLDTVKKIQEPVVRSRMTPADEKVVPIDETISVQLPAVPREFRAAWVATVANINWPTRNNLSVEQQKKEAVYLLDLLKENNFNAVIFQVRPSADALYKSSYEPWSYFLTGETGRAPQPYYDPLEFWVEEAHKRGLELHVWLNPYRAHHSNGGTVTSESIVRKASDYIVRLKNGMYWFDPSDPRTQDHSAAVVKDIVTRYDIDGVHFDDYFYPYASYNGGADFPDYKTWSAYQRSGGTLTRADWRRENVNKFIQRIYNEIKAEKNFVKFGLSPFGIWKPGYPAGITGSSQYDELYADAKLWLNKGWVDYFTPQLYWPIQPQRQSFPALLKWWESENTHHRHLWPGLNTVGINVADKSSEIINQVRLTREILPNSTGAVHWSIAGLTNNPDLLKKLREGLYASKALVPKSPWLKANVLLKPSLLLTDQQHYVFAKWLHKQPDQVFHWILYMRYGQEWRVEIMDSSVSSREIVRDRNGKKLNAVAVQAVDRLGNESVYIAKPVK